MARHHAAFVGRSILIVVLGPIGVAAVVLFSPFEITARGGPGSDSAQNELPSRPNVVARSNSPSQSSRDSMDGAADYGLQSNPPVAQSSTGGSSSEDLQSSQVSVGAEGGEGLRSSQPTAPGSGVGTGASLDNLPSRLRITGLVNVEASGDVVTRVTVPISVGAGETFNLAGAILRAEAAIDDTAHAVVPLTYTVTWQNSNGDSILYPGEVAFITVALPEGSPVHTDRPVALVFTPTEGPTMRLEDVFNQF